MPQKMPVNPIGCCRATGKPFETSPTDQHNVREIAIFFPAVMTKD